MLPELCQSCRHRLPEGEGGCARWEPEVYERSVARVGMQVGCFEEGDPLPESHGLRSVMVLFRRAAGAYRDLCLHRQDNARCFTHDVCRDCPRMQRCPTVGLDLAERQLLQTRHGEQIEPPVPVPISAVP